MLHQSGVLVSKGVPFNQRHCVGLSLALDFGSLSQDGTNCCFYGQKSVCVDRQVSHRAIGFCGKNTCLLYLPNVPNCGFNHRHRL